MKNKEKLKGKSQVILLLILLIASFSNADIIHKKDGTSVEGRIISQTGEKIVIESMPSFVKIEIPAGEVERIEKSKSDAIPDNFRVAHLKANTELMEGKPVEAIGTLLDAIETIGQSPSLVLSTLNADLMKALPLVDQNALNPDTLKDAIAQYETLLGFTGRPSFQNFSLHYPRWQKLSEELKSRIAQAYYKLAISDVDKKDPALYVEIEIFLSKAQNLTPKTDPQWFKIQESIGLFKMNFLKKYKEAEEIFKSGYEQASDSDTKQKFYDFVQWASKAIEENARARATALPSPTPFTARLIDKKFPAPTVPSPTPKRMITDENLPVGKQIRQFTANREYTKIVLLLFRTVMRSRILPIIVAIIVVLVLFWYLPVVIIRWRARHVDMLANKMFTLVQFTGIIGLFIYAVASVIKGVFTRDKRDRCPYCKKPIDNIDAYIDYNFRICPHCHENISPLYSLEDYILHLVKTVQSSMTMKAGYVGGPGVLEKDAMGKLIRGIIALAYQKRSSDVHIEPEQEGLKIRVRIDGMLYEILNLPKQVADTIVSAIKVMASLDISEKRIPQDGRISMWADNRDLDLRISTSPSARGEKVSIRILDPKAILVDSTKLGLEGDNLENFERTIRKPYGLILVTGPSGSGKSTTLYVALHTLNTGDKNIITIEDPIEYKLEGISQQQVHVAANFTFATGLRSILRQDPDVIMVGEIRDKETAEIGIDAATTGHLVFTTLHTIDSPTAFARLSDLGIPTKRFASVLLAIIAQRLIRLNCPDCKKPYKPQKSNLDQLEFTEQMGIVFMKGMGCQTCNNTGFFGRTGIFEVFIPDADMKKILETDPAISVISALARKKGMHTLKEEGILKITRGLTTVEEVLRVTT
jgi:type II secretory ATPase GspE/PulE/Tfp pilus assembly ATPase PilB-like protein